MTDLERVLQRAQLMWSGSQTAEGQEDVYLDAAALNLHSFYSALERLLTLIVRHIDRSLPDGETWHRELLLQVAADVPGVRPAVIGAETAHRLDELRRFRHLVRNVYTFSLQPEKMQPVFAELERLWVQLQAELLAFARFLDAVAGATE